VQSAQFAWLGLQVIASEVRQSTQLFECFVWIASLAMTMLVKGGFDRLNHRCHCEPQVKQSM